MLDQEGTQGKSGQGFSDWWAERSLAQKVLLGIGFGILGIGFVAFFGWIVMLLWNWVVPDLFGLKQINYWKAWGLLALCTVLFKGFGTGSSNGRNDRKRRRTLRRYVQEEQAQTGEAG